jgi:hypothetical protein
MNTEDLSVSKMLARSMQIGYPNLDNRQNLCPIILWILFTGWKTGVPFPSVAGISSLRHLPVTCIRVIKHLAVK